LQNKEESLANTGERKTQFKSISQVELETEKILTGQVSFFKKLERFYSDLLVTVLSINPNSMLYYLSCTLGNCQKKVFFE
jgi:hypothetical protein